jgi:hypothetical protein
MDAKEIFSGASLVYKICLKFPYTEMLKGLSPAAIPMDDKQMMRTLKTALRAINTP